MVSFYEAVSKITNYEIRLTHFNCPSTPTAEPFDRFLGHRREEVNQVAVGIAKQHSTVPPRHRGWFLYPLIDKRLQALVFGIDIVDAELDDDSVIVGRHCGTSAEQLHRLGVADRQGARWQNEFGKDGAGRSAETPMTFS